MPAICTIGAGVLSAAGIGEGTATGAFGACAASRAGSVTGCATGALAGACECDGEIPGLASFADTFVSMASSSSKSNTTGSPACVDWTSIPLSFLRRRRPPRRPRRRERASPSVDAAASCAGGVVATCALPVAGATTGVGAATGGASRFGRSGVGCAGVCGLRGCACCGFWRCGSARTLSFCGRGSRRCCCLLSPLRGRSRSRWPRESPRRASRFSSRR